MKIINKEQAIHTKKPEGLDVWYYLFKEYEVHLNVQSPKTTQVWHFHEKITETIFVIDGEMTAKWDEGGKIKTTKLHSGDLAETGNAKHTFENQSNSDVRFLVIKQVLTGKDKSSILKNDKQTNC